MNENNMNQTGNIQNGYPQSEQPYPQSEQPYPQSAYPQEANAYPQSGMPYPISGFDERKKTSTWQIVLISTVAILIVALAITLIVVLQDDTSPIVAPVNTSNTTIGTGLMSAPPGSVLLNGEQVTFEVIRENGKTFLPVKEFVNAIDFDCAITGDRIEIVSPAEIVTLVVGSTKVEFADQIAGGTSSVNITTAPFKRGDIVYVYSRDISFFLKNATVSYNPHLDVVEISVAGMTAPAGGQVPPAGELPPAGQLPPGGAPPQGVQPPQGGQVPPSGELPPAGQLPPGGMPPQK